MVAAAIKRGIDLAPHTQRRARIGLVCGLGVKKAEMLLTASPLIDAGHSVACVDGGWFSGEKAQNKIARVQRFLREWQPNVLVGTSAGGLLAIVAGFDLVDRIVTASSPLRWPRGRENTPKLLAIKTAVPALRGLRNEYYKRIRDNLGSSHTRILNFIGTEDELVPPFLSWMDGYSDGMKHIEHVIFPTPTREERGLNWAHTINTTGIFQLPTFQNFVAGGSLPAAA